MLILLLVIEAQHPHYTVKGPLARVVIPTNRNKEHSLDLELASAPPNTSTNTPFFLLLDT